MKIEVKLTKPLRPAVLSGAKVRLTFDDDTTVIVIADARILQNRQGDPWVSMPTYAVKDGNNIQYHPAVILNRELEKRVSDAILAAYEDRCVEQQPVRAPVLACNESNF